MAGDVAVVIAVVARDLGAEEGWGEVWFVGCSQLDFSKYKPFVVVVELIDLDGMYTVG